MHFCRVRYGRPAVPCPVESLPDGDTYMSLYKKYMQSLRGCPRFWLPGWPGNAPWPTM